MSGFQSTLPDYKLHNQALPEVVILVREAVVVLLEEEAAAAVVVVVVLLWEVVSYEALLLIVPTRLFQMNAQKGRNSHF